MAQPKYRVPKTREMPYEDRVQEAITIYKARFGSSSEISMRKAAKVHGVCWETVQDRLKGAIPRKLANEKMQRLSVFEESIIKQYCLQLYRWGWPTKCSQIRRMAVEILEGKGDTT